MKKREKNKPGSIIGNIANNRGICCAIVIAILCLAAFLINIPVIFDYDEVPMAGKVFMIIGTCLFPVLIPFVIVGTIKIKRKTLLSIDFWIIIAVFVLYYIYAVLHFFNAELWGIKKYYLSLLFCGTVIYVAFSFMSLFKNVFNGEKIVTILIAFALFFFIVGDKTENSNWLLLKIAGGILYAISLPLLIKMTLFSLENTKKGDENLILKLMVGIITSAGIVISFPFYINWCGLTDDNFKTFVSVYSALIGGGITLSGVAWTIRKTGKDKIEEEKKKYKPLFTVNELNNSGAWKTAGRKCNDYDNSKIHPYYATMEIENSEKNAFKIVSVFHDKNWYDLVGATTLLPNRKTILRFTFDDKNKLFLRVKDGLENSYYYKMTLTYMTVFPGKDNDDLRNFTIAALEDVSCEEVEKETANETQ